MNTLLITQIQETSDAVATLKVALAKEQQKKRDAWAGWKTCEDKYTLRRQVVACRESYERQVKQAEDNIKTITASLTEKQSLLDNLESQLEADQESQQILAEQGLTTDAVMQQAQIEADAKADATKSKAQAVKWVIILVGIAVVGLIVFYFVNKIRKGKKKN
jgi:hypothetical protein